MLTQPAPRTFRCSNCRAPIEFDAAAGALKCPYCGSTQVVESRGPAVEHGLREARQRGYGRAVKGQRCSDCGASVAFDAGLLSARCPFCASVRVADGDAEGLRPDNVLPFAVTPPEAKERFKKWMRGLWFRPNDLTNLAELQEIRGVYVPFWAFDVEARSWWYADAGYRIEQSAQGSNKPAGEQLRWEPVSGTRVDTYRGELVCASRGVPQRLLPRLNPFPLEQLAPYAPEFLAGWAAEAAAIDGDEAWRLAREALDKKQHQRCEAAVPGDTHRKLHVSTEYPDVRVKSALLPVYVAAYMYRGRTYRVLVNGQTGKVTGEGARSVAKILLAILVALLVAGGIALGIRLSQQPAARAPAAPVTRPAPAKEVAPSRPAKAPAPAPTQRRKSQRAP